MDTVLKVKEDYFLFCSYLLARAFVQIWTVFGTCAAPYPGPSEVSELLACRVRLTHLSDLADVEFFSPQWHSFNRRGGEWPTQEQPIAWQLRHSPRRWEM